MSVFLCVLISLILSFVLFMLGHFLPVRTPYLEKERPYECGFDPMKSSRTPFSFRFFLVAILFLIFDLEIVLLLPFLSGWSDSLLFCFLIISFFLLLLVIGLVYEWVKGGLDWAE